MLLGHLATYRALEHVTSGVSLEDIVAADFTWRPDEPAVRALLPDVEAALRPFGARPHWGKLFTTGADELAQLYPRMADFRELVRRYDPRGAFRNDYLDRTVASFG